MSRASFSGNSQHEMAPQTRLQHQTTSEEIYLSEFKELRRIIHNVNKMLTNYNYGNIVPDSPELRALCHMKKLSEHGFPSDGTVISFDINSLYPNVKSTFPTIKDEEHVLLYADTSEALCTICGWIPVLSPKCSSTRAILKSTLKILSKR